MDRYSDSLAHLATITSRNEALIIASALEHADVQVWIGADYHASVYPISVALGGHRLCVFQDQWEEASAIVREMELPSADVVFRGQRRRVLKFLGLLIASHLLLAVPAATAGLVPVTSIATIFLLPLGVPVDPRGQNDYYLAPEK